MGWMNPWGYGYGGGYGYGAGYGCGAGGYGRNGFVLLVVLFILLIIVGNSFPMGGDYD
ncbi:YjcZ family sporulation protein [Virgibacillus doumboii]|uniref:YjcZ family sporulation protein n=1 Tax=Virgibacillus doumboii TaxID=2697503 RepID=UPI0013DFB9D2|nr:YjcZ family sporulation protein [Virgibacillus doumboii]